MNLLNSTGCLCSQKVLLLISTLILTVNISVNCLRFGGGVQMNYHIHVIKSPSSGVRLDSNPSSKIQICFIVNMLIMSSIYQKSTLEEQNRAQVFV